jgi:16S rRNA (cytosine967-C5)-methyltransferase
MIEMGGCESKRRAYAWRAPPPRGGDHAVTEPAPIFPLELLPWISDALAECARGRRPRDAVQDTIRTADLDASQSASLGRAVYRAVQQIVRLEFLTGGLEKVDRPMRAHALGIASAVADLAIAPEDARRLCPVPGLDWRRVADGAARIARIDDPLRRFGLEHALPEALARHFLDEFGEEAAEVASGLNAAPPRTIRANTLRVPNREELAAELAAGGVVTRPTARAPDGLVVESDAALFRLDAFREGRFEQQDEASQLCALLTAPPPRGRVLDACAGSGGKTLALAALLRNRGEILAADPHEGRLEDLVQRRRRAGVDVVRSVCVGEDSWPEEVVAFARRADRILIDAPCSGVGSWRRRPEARHSFDEAGLTRLRRVQSDLLDRALLAVPPGGRVVYATCSMFRTENEEQVESALQRHPEIEVMRAVEILGKALGAPITDPTGTYLKLAPHQHGTDGFFAAVLRRPPAKR